MTRIGNQKILIDELESLEKLNHRYSNIVCINCPDSGNRRGVLSLVFQANDDILEGPVAIKFLDPAVLSDQYRLEAFRREPEILEKVVGRQRCLQLLDGLQTHNLNLQLGGSIFQAPMQYFVTEWIEEDIDDYSLLQDKIDAIDKLRIFRLVILALESLHSNDIHHRDIKIDNIRLKKTSADNFAVFIDFGTAARVDSPSALSPYTEPVGAPGYAPPEAFTGLSGDRNLGPVADKYAMGALLFSFFNKDEFYVAREKETDFSRTVILLNTLMSTQDSSKSKKLIWGTETTRLRHLTTAPDIMRLGNTVPSVAQSVLCDCYSSLIKFDFNERRISMPRCRALIDIAIKSLTNQKIQSNKHKKMRAARARRREVAYEKQRRLDSYMSRSRRLESA